MRHDRLVSRLSTQSVLKQWEPYRDIDWEAPEHQVDPADPRWELPAHDPLGATAWYRAQPPEVRSAMGLHAVATMIKKGIQFENVLNRGLLGFATTLPNSSLEFRYVFHEVIEECQHSLMFQEFLNRTGVDVPGDFARRERLNQIARLGQRFPTLFFLFVLGGEAPIDHYQRQALVNGRARHPLLRRILRIHITEEARHLSFAKSYLREAVPRLSWLRRTVLAHVTPVLLHAMARTMLTPWSHFIERYEIPKGVIEEAYRDNPTYFTEIVFGLRGVHALCGELGLLTPTAAALWRRLRLA